MPDYALLAGLLVSLFLLPTLYTWFARPTDKFRDEPAGHNDELDHGH